MAKKANASGRSDPRQNKSLAIRTVLSKSPNAKATEVATAVKKEYGHDVSKAMIYMIKTNGSFTPAQKKLMASILRTVAGF